MADDNSTYDSIATDTDTDTDMALFIMYATDKKTIKITI